MRNIKAYVSIALGILFCGSALIGYMPIPEYAMELTCISNLCIGILLVCTGINILRNKKKIPGILYQMWLAAILFVCIISCVGHFNFQGAFFFLHLVNPLVFLVYYVIFIEDTPKGKKILLTPMPVMGYLIFDYIIGMVRGTFVYGIFEVHRIGLTAILGIACGAYFFVLMIAVITQSINQKIREVRSFQH